MTSGFCHVGRVRLGRISLVCIRLGRLSVSEDTCVSEASSAN